jgi:hypothetical protein
MKKPEPWATGRRRPLPSGGMLAGTERRDDPAALRALLAELLEEWLQRIGKIVETAAVEIEGEAIAVFVGNRLDAAFDANGDDGRRDGIDDIGEARNGRRLNLDGFSVGTCDFEGNAGCQHRSGKTGDGRGLEHGLSDGALMFFSIRGTFFIFKSTGSAITGSVDE